MFSIVILFLKCVHFFLFVVGLHGALVCVVIKNGGKAYLSLYLQQVLRARGGWNNTSWKRTCVRIE